MLTGAERRARSVAAARPRLLHRWTLDRTVGTKHAAVAGPGPQQHVARAALVEEDANVRRHNLDGREAARRTREDALEDRRLLPRG
jgi:hypothetical protein